MKKKASETKTKRRPASHRKKTSSSSGRKYELWGLVLVAVSLISLCGIFGLNVGFVGIYFARFLQYLFGVGAVVTALVIALVGFQYIVHHQRPAFTLRFFGLTLLFLSILAVWHHMKVPPGSEILAGSLVQGGGFFGGALLLILRKLFGVDGAIILLMIGVVGAILLSTTWSLANGLLKTKHTAQKGADVANAAISATYTKVADAGSRLEEHVVETVREKREERERRAEEERMKSFYNQAEDPHFAGAKADQSDAKTGKKSDAKPADTSKPTSTESEQPHRRSIKEIFDALTRKKAAERALAAATIVPHRADASQNTSVLPAVKTAVGTAAGLAGSAGTALAAPAGTVLTSAAGTTAVASGIATAAPMTAQAAAVTAGIATAGIAVKAGAEALASTIDTPAATPKRGFTIEYGRAEEPSAGGDETASTMSVDTPTENKLTAKPSPDVNVKPSADAAKPIDITAGVTEADLDALDAAAGAKSDVKTKTAKAAEAGKAAAEAMVAEAEAEAAELTSTENTEPAPKPYVVPLVTDILEQHIKKQNVALEMEIEENAHTLQQTLTDFHVKAKIINACHGPAVTRYELEPAPGVKVSKITNLADDIALSLAAVSVRIEPIPGKAAIGIEVPNKTLESVHLREVLDHKEFYEAKSRLTVGLGIDISGHPIYADLAKMPHLLVAGATGSGKSVCINTLITSVLFKAKPDEVKFILIDPKMVELSNYNGIPHLMVPVVTDAKKAASVLNWSVQEMEKRYKTFADRGVRNMGMFNEKFPDEKMPAVVIIIDELADLMMVAPHDVEDAICRLAQKARAAGIHMVLATQRPSVDVITGIIKANIPSRISFAVSSQIDSRTILDRSGAEKLLGRGDMLFYPIGASKPVRVQGAFISDDEVEQLLESIRSQGQKVEANEEIIRFTENAMKEEEEPVEEKAKPKQDELLADAVDFVMTSGRASTSSIQVRFRIGYTRAARLIDTMEELHIIGPSMGSKPREILMTADEAFAAIGSPRD